MHTFLLILCCLLINFTAIKASNAAQAKDDVDYQDALLQINTTYTKSLIISIRNQECYECKLIEIAQINNLQNYTIRINTFYPYYFLYINTRQSSDYVCNDLFADAYYFGENGSYYLEISSKNDSSFECKMNILTEPEPLYTPIYIAIGVFTGFGLLYALCKYLYKKYYHVLSVRYANRNIINSDFGTISASTSSTANLLNGNTEASRSKVKSGRMKSVDAFRGLCLAIMIFANYGAGGYSILVSL